MVLSRLIMAVVSRQAGNVVNSMHANPAYSQWMKVSMVADLVSNPVLLAAGIALLLLRNWGRITSIVYGIYAIIWALVGAFMAFVILKSGMPGGLERFGSIGVAVGLISAVVGLALSLAYPVLLLVFMTRANVVAAFRPAAPINPPAISETPRSTG
jgi:hypothetical protein